MSTPLRIRQIQIIPLAIPLRFHFEHAAASRAESDPVIVRLSAASPFAHHIGYGETLAREYVTGESTASVIDDIQEVFVPLLRELHADTFADALEIIESLPSEQDGRVITAARAAVELALTDLTCRVYRRRAADIVRWMELPGFGAPGCLREASYSGIVVGQSAAKICWSLRAQRCYGLRDFKIKVALDGWQERLECAHRALGGAIARESATLRADANGGWSCQQAIDAMPLLEEYGVSALEQPMADTDDALLPEITEKSKVDLIADESLITLGDADRLINARAVRVFNIRIAKNGGLMPSLRMARRALAAGLDVQLGCLVGETSILAAAGVAFLEACPKVRFIEGAFGRFLLRDDVARRSIRFGRGGRIGPQAGFGLGVAVRDSDLKRLAAAAPVIVNF